MQFPFTSSSTPTPNEIDEVVQEAVAILTEWKRVVISHNGLTTAEQTNLRHRILDVCVQINKVGACEVGFIGNTLDIRVASGEAEVGIDEIVAAAKSSDNPYIDVKVY